MSGKEEDRKNGKEYGKEGELEDVSIPKFIKKQETNQSDEVIETVLNE